MLALLVMFIVFGLFAALSVRFGVDTRDLETTLNSSDPIRAQI